MSNTPVFDAFRWARDHSLSLVFTAGFLIALGIQSFTGLAGHNSTLVANHRPPIGYGQFLATGDFLDGVFVNWQAAILQLFCLIAFGSFLHQRGASHSRKPEGDGGKSERDGQGRSWLYRHSMSVAFAAMFVLSFAGHVVAGTMLYNENLALTGQPAVSTGAYLASGTFWFQTMQTWQAEFAAVVVFVIASVYLRQQGSPESKPVDSGDEETGETNK